MFISGAATGVWVCVTHRSEELDDDVMGLILQKVEPGKQPEWAYIAYCSLVCKSYLF
jgi:hypothetical protein